MKQETVHEAQAKMKAMLKVFHCFCENNNLRYCLIGGTLLGAIRHKNFIPWDDDVDIGMPRPDYDRFIELATSFPEPFTVSHRGNDDNYIYPYAKCYDQSTTVTENFFRPFRRGVWLDIFPIDGTFCGKMARSAQLFSIKVIRGFINTKQGSYYPENDKPGLPRTALAFLLFIVPLRVLYFLLSRCLLLVPYEQAKFVANLLGQWGDREVVRKNVFNDRIRVNFGELMLWAPELADEYLRHVYGDYMVIPPEDRRKTRHSNTVFELNRPWQ